jgi:shikimate dehydrogenase
MSDPAFTSFTAPREGSVSRGGPAQPTDQYVVAGNPVEHSQSPFIHAEFARQTGEHLHYERLLCPLDSFAATLRAFAQGSAAGPARGCNVTTPFKFEAFRLCAEVTARAALAGAANTLRFDADGWFGDNTDGIGLARDIERGAGVALAGRKVLLIGAGGAAAGVLGPLLATRPALLTLSNRSIDKAHALVERHRHAPGAQALRVAALRDCGTGFDVIVNATATSLQGAAAPVSPAVLAPGALALDMMYGPRAAPFLAWAAEHGAVARDGLGMLVEQAAEAFFVWRGVRPQTGPVLAALRQRLNG